MSTKTPVRLIHEEIYQDLARKITTGEIADKQQIPTLLELCAQYGVSTSSVRRALGDLERDGLISKTRGRGTFAIRRLQRRRKIYVLLETEHYDLHHSPIQNVYELFDLLAGIRDAIREAGDEMVFISRAGTESVPLMEECAGGLVIANSWRGRELEIKAAVESRGAPCVLVNPPNSVPPCVRVDGEAAAFLAVDYLARLGHRRIAYVGYARWDWYEPRLKGYLRALKEHRLEFDPDLVQSVYLETQEAPALDTVLALADPATAVFAESDFRALRLMAHAKERGWSIPGDFSLCGYLDVAEASLVQPSLTTVLHPSVVIGRESARLLNDLIDGREPESRDVLVPATLVPRESTAPPPRRRRPRRNGGRGGVAA